MDTEVYLLISFIFARVQYIQFGRKPQIILFFLSDNFSNFPKVSSAIFSTQISQRQDKHKYQEKDSRRKQLFFMRKRKKKKKKKWSISTLKFWLLPRKFSLNSLTSNKFLLISFQCSTKLQFPTILPMSNEGKCRVLAVILGLRNSCSKNCDSTSE